jgi:hypothetical protein
MLLARFSVPGHIAELPEPALQAWSAVVSSLFDDVTPRFPRLYNPTVTDTPEDHRIHDVKWPAFPGTFLTQRTSSELRWKAADASREAQDEYCEWSVTRDGDGKVQRVTFTSETPGYYEHLMEVAPDLLLSLYEQATGKAMSLDALRDDNGFYNPDNEFNNSTEGPIVHLAQGDNNLGAAVRLAGEATILRERNGMPVVHPQTLVRCGGLGVATRHSDPQIASAVNNLVASGFDITLADPAGLYLDELVTTGMTTPDGANAQEFWTVERGDPDHVVRATFEVPAERGYSVGDITIGGRPIRFGAQLADRLHVRLRAVAKPGVVDVERQPCVN